MYAIVLRAVPSHCCDIKMENRDRESETKVILHAGFCVCVCVSEKRKTTESTKRKSLPLPSVYPDDYRALKVSLTTVRDGSLSFSSSPPKIPFNSFASFMKFPRLFRTNQTIHTKYFDYTLNAILFLVIFWMHRG